MDEDFTACVVPSAKIDDPLWKRLEALFDETYAQANFDYLKKSASTFRYLAIAEKADKLVGFSFGDSVRGELPGFAAPQPIALAGIACIDASMRQRGLFFRLATEAMNAGGAINPSEPFVFAGRMAHPITYRAMAKGSDTTVPTATTAPSTVATTTPATASATDPVDDADAASISTVGVVIGTVGTLVLIGIAGWWMARRDDEDDAPHPPGPSSYSDLI